jgi:hypothetical protein
MLLPHDHRRLPLAVERASRFGQQRRTTMQIGPFVRNKTSNDYLGQIALTPT